LYSRVVAAMGSVIFKEPACCFGRTTERQEPPVSSQLIEQSRWAVALLGNPRLRNQVCSSTFRRFDVDRTGTMKGADIDDVIVFLSEQLGTPQVDASVLDEALAKSGKDRSSPLSLEDTQRIYELCLRSFTEAPAEEKKVTDAAAAKIKAGPVTLEGAVQKRGLSFWNFAWYPAYLELRSDSLHIYDLQANGDRSLVGVIELENQLQVQAQGELDFMLLPEGEAVMPDLMSFAWRAESKQSAEKWVELLGEACSAGKKTADDNSEGDNTTADGSYSPTEVAAEVTP